jgi:hypothetical protein
MRRGAGAFEDLGHYSLTGLKRDAEMGSFDQFQLWCSELCGKVGDDVSRQEAPLCSTGGPPLRPDRKSSRMARADQVKAGLLGRREAAWP